MLAVEPHDSGAGAEPHARAGRLLPSKLMCESHFHKTYIIAVGV